MNCLWHGSGRQPLGAFGMRKFTPMADEPFLRSRFKGVGFTDGDGRHKRTQTVGPGQKTHGNANLPRLLCPGRHLQRLPLSRIGWRLWLRVSVFTIFLLHLIDIFHVSVFCSPPPPPPCGLPSLPPLSLPSLGGGCGCAPPPPPCGLSLPSFSLPRLPSFGGCGGCA